MSNPRNRKPSHVNEMISRSLNRKSSVIVEVAGSTYKGANPVYKWVQSPGRLTGRFVKTADGIPWVRIG
jgi:hypothetical protein